MRAALHCRPSLLAIVIMKLAELKAENLCGSLIPDPLLIGLGLVGWPPYSPMGGKSLPQASLK